MNELLKKDIINLYSKKEIISTYMLNDIKDEFISSNKMNQVNLNFVKSIHKTFDKSKQGYIETYLEGFAGYNNNSVKLYRTKLMLYYLYIFNKDNIYMLNEDEIFKFNIDCLNSLIHELVHAKQDQITNNIIESKEAITKILKADFSINDQTFYDLYYDYFVSEYNANLEASIYINKLLNNTKLKHFNTYNSLGIINKAYEDKPLATEFINIIGHDINDYKINELDKKERILYGFPRR